jgi:uncharacterized protein YjcR
MSEEMDEEEPVGAVYREILEGAREGIERARRLMESEDEATVRFAMESFVIMSDYAVEMAQLLGEGSEPADSRHPLARRARIEG